MQKNTCDFLQIREVFHLGFLRWLGRELKASQYALKGGSNLRFFFNSFRYSEDMDLDVRGVKVSILKGIVMEILGSRPFKDNMKVFGMSDVIGPDMAKAKQTETTQRFKIHLITVSGEDLFTKIEFSRRGIKGNVVIEPVSDVVLRAYKLVPLLVPHYDITSTISQKIGALAGRAMVQARDVFDIYILSSQYKILEAGRVSVDTTRLKKAHENIFEINFEQFKDTVISYLSLEEQRLYSSEPLWDEIKLKAADFIEELRAHNA